MKNKPLTKFKFENVVFMILAIVFIYGATTRINSDFNPFGALSNFYTIMIQLTLSYALKLLLEYIRKNPEQLANDIRSLFQDN